MGESKSPSLRWGRSLQGALRVKVALRVMASLAQPRPIPTPVITSLRGFGVNLEAQTEASAVVRATAGSRKAAVGATAA